VCTAEFPRTETVGCASFPIMSKTFRRYVPKQDLLAPPSLPIGCGRDGKLLRRWYSGFIGRTGSQSSPVFFETSDKILRKAFCYDGAKLFR
jgi:hypothetical protein